ncbi:MAG: hypothetical protein OEZ68_05030 [Gammaproteobacteria bacterium]|nr:hypothetical protein [Gammaproteobacteria bacterium]MDH5800152.1 hypothetical protein [Gammaproteobacteria bacterium]
MDVYDVDKLMQQARKLATQYRQATGKPLGISNEIAVHDVVRLMNLQPVVDASESTGFDAIGSGTRLGKKIQIKGRSISGQPKPNQRVGQIKLEQDWDSVMLILMNDNYEPLQIYEADRAEIEDAVKSSSAKRRNRGALSVARFMKIGSLVWSCDAISGEDTEKSVKSA